jgi:hypothetical protein
MPLPPLLGLLGGAAGTKALEKQPRKKIAVNGRVKKDGTRSKAHLRNAR